MKKIILIILAMLLLGILPTTVLAGVNTMTWIDPHFDWGSKDKIAHVNAAVAKLEGTVNAYSANQNPNVAKQTFVAVDDLSDSLEELNAVVAEIYPTLTEEEQLAVRNAYSSFGLYLEDLAAKTNSVFGREVFRVDYRELERGRFLLFGFWEIPYEVN